MSKPLVFLDVDGVLWNIPDNNLKETAPSVGASDFLLWLNKNCEVRWLTSWATTGIMSEENIERLCNIFIDVHPDVFRSFNHSSGWVNSKCEALDWNELKDREWFWVEDGLLENEMNELTDHGFSANFLQTDVFDDPEALQTTFLRIRKIVELNE